MEPKISLYKVWTNSVEFGAEDFSYNTLKECYMAIARLATTAATLDDDVERSYEIEAIYQEIDEEDMTNLSV